MNYFPAFMDLKNRTAVVIGGGDVAARKAAVLSRAGAHVRVVAPELGTDLAALAKRQRIDHLAAGFEPRQLDGAALVVAATNDPGVNALVSRHARLRGQPVNVVDDPSLSTFIMPAIVDRAPVTVAISTGGASPVLARLVRARIEAALPPALGRLAALAGRYRDRVRNRLPDTVARRRFWEGVFDGPVPELVAAGKIKEAGTALEDRLAAPQRGPEGQVFLVGAGPGDPDLLTLRALRLLQQADVVVHDRLVTPAVLDLARRDARRIDVGKRCGRQVMAQDEINALLVRLARDGQRVVRLKGGDPFVFGRGGEEALALAEAGIACHVVPGITAAVGCGACAGIPLTHRGVAQQCVFVTGHGRDGGDPALNWAALARPNQTVVIYMGVRTLGRVAARLIEHGLPDATPAAIVENGTTPEERVIVGTLRDIDAHRRAAAVTGPALVVVGEVVALRGRLNSASPELAVAV